MKRITVLLFALGIGIAGPLYSQSENIVGAGLVIGEPTGITAKVWLEEGFAWDAAIAWSFVGDSSLYIHTNGLYHFRVLDTSGGNFLTPYVGGGLSFRFEDDLNMGLRIPFGVSWLLDEVPVEVFAEIAPGVGLIPETDFELGAGLGARFYFTL